MGACVNSTPGGPCRIRREGGVGAKTRGPALSDIYPAPDFFGN